MYIELHLICSFRCCTLPCHAYLNRTCIILGCASCHDYACLFIVVFASFRLCFSSIVPVTVAIVRICSTTPIRLPHGLVLLPNGILGKMTITLDLITIIAMLVASFYRYVALPILFFKPPNLPCQPLTFFTLPSKLLFGYVTALLSPSYSVVSCR